MVVSLLFGSAVAVIGVIIVVPGRLAFTRRRRVVKVDRVIVAGIAAVSGAWAWLARLET